MSGELFSLLFSLFVLEILKLAHALFYLLLDEPCEFRVDREFVDHFICNSVRSILLDIEVESCALSLITLQIGVLYRNIYHFFTAFGPLRRNDIAAAHRLRRLFNLLAA